MHHIILFCSSFHPHPFSSVSQLPPATQITISERLREKICIDFFMFCTSYYDVVHLRAVLSATFNYKWLYLLSKEKRGQNEDYLLDTFTDFLIMLAKNKILRLKELMENPSSRFENPESSNFRQKMICIRTRHRQNQHLWWQDVARKSGCFPAPERGGFSKNSGISQRVTF